MKITRKNQSIERKNSDICLVTEYPPMDDHLDFAIVKISGKYPSKGAATNLQCKEIVFVHEGAGTVVVNGAPQRLEAGDVVLIEPGEHFVWEGNMNLFIACHPAFSLEQHTIVDAGDSIEEGI
jgi:mannose-6-phosphate isomerase-like protein (cupin superfamily)